MPRTVKRRRRVTDNSGGKSSESLPGNTLKLMNMDKNVIFRYFLNKLTRLVDRVEKINNSYEYEMNDMLRSIDSIKSVLNLVLITSITSVSASISALIFLILKYATK